jgi:hypothetical protein
MSASDKIKLSAYTKPEIERFKEEQDKYRVPLENKNAANPSFSNNQDFVELLMGRL